MVNYGWMRDEGFVYLVKSLWRKNKETRIESFTLQFVFNLEQVKHVVLSQGHERKIRNDKEYFEEENHIKGIHFQDIAGYTIKEHKKGNQYPGG